MRSPELECDCMVVIRVYAQHVRMGKTSPVMSDARCGFFPIPTHLGPLSLSRTGELLVALHIIRLCMWQ